jgi:hypothetical protein
MPSLRQTILDRQQAAGLPVGDVVFAILPGGEKRLVWGQDVLAAIIQVNKAQECIVTEVRVADAAKADELSHRYWTACDEAEGHS